MSAVVADVTIPIQTVSEPNQRDHRYAKHRRTSEQRGITKISMRPRLVGARLPLTITLVRLAERQLDGDNLHGALKAVRDGVADALGLANDSHPGLTWICDQAKAKRGTWAVRIVVASGSHCGVVFPRAADGVEVRCLLPMGHACAHHWEAPR